MGNLSPFPSLGRPHLHHVVKRLRGATLFLRGFQVGRRPVLKWCITWNAGYQISRVMILLWISNLSLHIYNIYIYISLIMSITKSRHVFRTLYFNFYNAFMSTAHVSLVHCFLLFNFCFRSISRLFEGDATSNSSALRATPVTSVETDGSYWVRWFTGDFYWDL